MKKIIFILVCVFSMSVFSQEEITEGIVKSKQTMSSDNEQMKQSIAMIGDVLTTTYFKNNKTYSETFSLMTGNTIAIMDNDKKEMLVMMDNQMVGKKYMLKSTEQSDEDLEGVKVVKGDETKTILGYECQEYIITVVKDGVEVIMNLFVTDKISALSPQITRLGADLKGFPMYMEMNMSQAGMSFKIISEVTAIEKAEVSDDKFDMTALEGYEKTDKLMGF